MKWEKYKSGWLRRSPSPESGVGDFIFNTLTKIVYDNDASEWAFNCFEYCWILLKGGFRWPKEFGDTYQGRKRTDMTADPYIAFGRCYTHFLGRGYDKSLTEMVEEIHPPLKFWIFKPRFIAWWIHLTRDKRKYFIQRLDYLMGAATKKNHEIKHAKELLDFYNN